MDLSLKYSKTSKGAKAVLAKSRALSSSVMLVLSNIDGKTPASVLQEKLQLNEEKFTQALSQLLNEAFIQVVQDFGPSIFDLKSAMEVSEISTEEFFKLELPEETTNKSQEQIEAEERARLYAEEQARKEAQAREQEEAERKLLKVTDILGKSGHKIDIEKLSEDDPANAMPTAVPKNDAPKPQTLINDSQQPQSEATGKEKQPSLDFTHSPLVADTEAIPVAKIPIDEPEPVPEPEREAQKQAEEQARQLELRKQEDVKQQQRAEAEAARKLAEQQAREEAKVRARAEEEARAEAERVRRQEAEAQAKLKAEEKALKEEVRRARKAAEAARKLAEQQARGEAKARAKAEAERKAKEESQRRAQERAEAEARAREVAERKAREKAVLQAQRAAEAEAKAEAARKAKEEAHLRNEKLAAEKAIAKAEAKRQAEARAIIRAEEWAQTYAAIRYTGSAWAKKFQTFGRPVLIGFAVITVGLLVLLHFVSLAMWIPPVEQAIAANIGEPVKIRDMRISLWPQPHMVLEEVSIGPLADISVRTINAYPKVFTLFKDHKELDALEIEELSVDQENLQRPARWLSTAAQHRTLKLSAVSLKEVTIKAPELEVPAFNANVQLDEQGQFASASLNANNLVVNIVPENNVLTVNIQGQDWVTPMGTAITFDELSATGTLEQNQLDLKKVEGRLYEGTVQGRLLVTWGSGWKADGSFELAKIDLAQATPALSELTGLQGRLYAAVDVDSNANDFKSLIDESVLRARFEAEEGQIGGLDLSRAAAGREQVGGVTRYEQVSGNWVKKNRQYQLTQVKLKAGSLNAQGEIGISPQQELSGRVQTHLDLGARNMQARFNLAGKLGSVRIHK